MKRVGPMDLQDLRDQKGCQVLTDQGDQVDLQETKGHLECQGHKGQRVTQEKMGATDFQAQLGPLGRGVLLAILDLQGCQEKKVSQEPLEPKETKEKMGGTDSKGRGVLLAILDLQRGQEKKVSQELKETKEKLDPLVKMETREQWAHRALQEKMHQKLSRTR